MLHSEKGTPIIYRENAENRQTPSTTLLGLGSANPHLCSFRTRYNCISFTLVAEQNLITISAKIRVEILRLKSVLNQRPSTIGFPTTKMEMEMALRF